MPSAPAQPNAAPAAQLHGTPGFDAAAIHRHIPGPHEHNSIWSSPSDSHFRAENVSLVG
jgi:hypothetical protein